MRNGPLSALLGAALLTAVLLPVTYWFAPGRGRDGHPAGLGIVVLCVLRAICLLTAFYLLRGDGRWYRWTVMGSVVAFEIALAVLLFLSIDQTIQAPFPLLFGVLATLLPLLAVTAVWRGGVPLYMGAATAGMVVALGGVVAYGPLTAQWRAERTAAAHPELAGRLAALQAVPGNAAVEEYLAFTGPEELEEVRIVALARMEKQTPAILDMLDGPRRLEALYVLQDWFHRLPDEDRGRCWTAIGKSARDIATRKQAGETLPQREISLWKQPALLMERRRDAVAERHAADREEARQLLRLLDE